MFSARSKNSSISMVSAASITLSAVASSASAVLSSVWTLHSLSSVLWRSAVDWPSFISACRRVSVGYSEAGVGVKESLPPSGERSPSVFLAMVLSETGLPVFSSYHLPSRREYCLLFQDREDPSTASRMLSEVSSASSGTSAEEDSAPSRRSSICLLSRELPSASAQELSPRLVYLPPSEVNTVPVGYDPALGRLLLELRALAICSSDRPGALSRSALTSIISMVEGLIVSTVGSVGLPFLVLRSTSMESALLKPTTCPVNLSLPIEYAPTPNSSIHRFLASRGCITHQPRLAPVPAPLNLAMLCILNH